MPNALDALASLASGLVGPVAISTNLNASQPLLVSPIPGAPAGAPGAASGGSTGANSILQWLQPEVAIQLPTGEMSVAPFGKPSADYGVTIMAGAAALALGAMALGAAGGRGAVKPLIAGAVIAGIVGVVASKKAAAAALPA